MARECLPELYFKYFTKRFYYIWWHPIWLGLKQLFLQFHKVSIWSKHQVQRASLPGARHRILADAWTFPTHLPAHTLWAARVDCGQLILQDNNITDNYLYIILIFHNKSNQAVIILSSCCWKCFSFYEFETLLLWTSHD